MPSFVIFFVDVHESRRLNLPDDIPSPYGALCRVVSGYGNPNMGNPFRNFRMMWADEDNNLTPLMSDRMLMDALRLRRGPWAPLHIYVKGGRPPPEFMGNGAIRSRSNSLTLRAANRPLNPKDRMVQEQPPRPYGPMPNKPEYTRWMPAASVNRTSFEGKGKDFRASLMPKDPTLAELVDNVRQNLEAALKSVQFCAAPVPDHEEVAERSVEVPTIPLASDYESDSGTLVGTDEESKNEEDDKPKENDLVDALEEGATTPRPCSSASGEFMVLTPSTDSCPLALGERDFEAVFSEIDSEFEVVDAPDDWDSDVETDWRSVSFNESLIEHTA